MNSDGQYDGFSSSVNFLLFSMNQLAMPMRIEELFILDCISSFLLQLEKKKDTQ